VWISNTATAALLLPVALGILGRLERSAGTETARRARPHLLLGIAYAASIAGLGTLVGSPPNAIAAAALGLGFADWLAATAPLFVPIIFELATSLHQAPAERVVPVAVACSCAFMLPIATPPNAIVFGSGRLEQRTIMRVGLVLNLLFAVLITALDTLLF
jgi:sodium-dependent dicarboxylate transporter 2/3/5